MTCRSKRPSPTAPSSSPSITRSAEGATPMKPTRSLLLAAGLSLLAAPASAHVGVGDTSSFAAGFGHPLFGLDHLVVMIAVGAWAAMKGGRALWAWPVAF